MAATRTREKNVLSRQDIQTRRKELKKARQKTSTGGGTGQRAIAGVAVFTVSVLALLSVASFSAHDRLGPGFHNYIGPVGHAIAEALRGLLGLCSFVLPFAGFYVTGLIVKGDTQQRRWPQVACLGLLLLSGSVFAQLVFKEDASWAHAPGGLIGRELGGVLVALFGKVGTVVLVSAISAVALIIGTRFAFLSFCEMVWNGVEWAGAKAKAWAIAFIEAQQKRLELRKEMKAKAAIEEAEFLAQLEDEEAELNELEEAAMEAESAAEEMARQQRDAAAQKLAEAEAARNAKQLEKEARMLEREAVVAEREALKFTVAAHKETEKLIKEKERLDAMGPMPQVPTFAPGLPVQTTPVEPTPALAPLNGDPAWTMSFMPQQPAPAAKPMLTAAPVTPMQHVSQPPRAAKIPNIVEHMIPPPPPADVSMPPHKLNAADMSTLTASDIVSAVPLDSAQAIAPVAAVATLKQISPGHLPEILLPRAPPKPTVKKDQALFEFANGRERFVAPSLDVLDVKQAETAPIDKDIYYATAQKLTAKLKDFNIEGEVVNIRPGPVITMYEFKPAPGVKISKIAGLADDLAMAMEAMRVRIVAPIPGKGVVGIEVPNEKRQSVFLREIAEQDLFQKSPSKLTMCLGKDVEGQPYVLDLQKAPHLLVAGTTGSGKSVGINSMIMSLLLKSTPEEVRMIMIDPKMLEFSIYDGIPHLLLPVVSDMRKAPLALQWAVDEMERRYRMLAEVQVRDIGEYNKLVDAELRGKSPGPVIEGKVVPPPAPAPVVEAKAEVAPPAPAAEVPGKKKRRLLIVDVEENQAAAAPIETPSETPAIGVAAPTAVLEDPREGLSAEVQAEILETKPEIRVDQETAEEAAALAVAVAENQSATTDAPKTDKKKLPYIVVVVDEFADLMMIAAKEVETSIARIAQKARAAGIHLILATQRPSTDVVTGLIKANFPTRVSFMLRQKIDSMVILGSTGAEALLGNGDMLILPPTSPHLQRVHGAYVSGAEIKKAVEHLKAQGKPVYDETILKPREEEGAEPGGGDDGPADETYDKAVGVVANMKQVSISLLQRRMGIGYNKSANIIERMEREGVVGPANGVKPREVLIYRPDMGGGMPMSP